MSPCSSRVTLHQPLPLSGFAAILRFDPNPVFSVISALFAQMCHAGSPASQAESTASTHFPSATGGVWERTNVRSILASDKDASRVYPELRRRERAQRLRAAALAKAGVEGPLLQTSSQRKSDELTHMDSHFLHQTSIRRGCES